MPISIRQTEEHWEVWTDAMENDFDGHCIGSSGYKIVALQEAQESLLNDLDEVRAEMKVIGE